MAPTPATGVRPPAAELVSTAGPGARRVTLTNLAPGSTVHFEVVAGNAVQQGIVTDDQTLTTATQIAGVVGTPLQMSDSGLADGCPGAPTVDWGDNNSDNQASVNCTAGPEDRTANAVSDSHIYTLGRPLPDPDHL